MLLATKWLRYIETAGLDFKIADKQFYSVLIVYETLDMFILLSESSCVLRADKGTEDSSNLIWGERYEPYALFPPIFQNFDLIVDCRGKYYNERLFDW